jgi:hypothetical protein
VRIGTAGARHPKLVSCIRRRRLKLGSWCRGPTHWTVNDALTALPRATARGHTVVVVSRRNGRLKRSLLVAAALVLASIAPGASSGVACGRSACAHRRVLQAFNARDNDALKKTLHYPTFASTRLAVNIWKDASRRPRTSTA